MQKRIVLVSFTIALSLTVVALAGGPRAVGFRLAHTNDAALHRDAGRARQEHGAGEDPRNYPGFGLEDENRDAGDRDE